MVVFGRFAQFWGTFDLYSSSIRSKSSPQHHFIIYENMSCRSGGEEQSEKWPKLNVLLFGPLFAFFTSPASPYRLLLRGQERHDGRRRRLGPAASGLHPVEDFLFLGKQNVPPRKVISESIYDLRATQSARNRGRFEERDVVGVQASFDQGTGEG